MQLAATRTLIFFVLVSCLRVSHAQEESSFPEIYNSEPELEGFLSAEEALAKLKLPDGFTAELFASEPEVQNPIAGCTDAQGRVWIAENYTYAERAQRFDMSLNDRVVVLEDSNGDGKADKRTVFTDTVQMLTGITVGRGGVWLMCPPQLLFIPDADGDLVPDGPPEVKLDGFQVGRENYHNFANGLSWGPDNWLYGRCGASAPGEMGLPGCTDEERVPIRGGIWRFHPERNAFESLTQGTTNPWGNDWNERGDLFFINTVNGHFWHAIPGAHFVRPHTLDMNPHIYELIDMHADHWHFDTGKSWTASRAGAANDYGGGHAHVGMIIYQEDHWPERYRNRVMTVNMHGRRVNTEVLEREGAGYVARHGEDFLLSDDVWFRGMELLPLPDGNLLLLDWSDTGECHDSTGVHRTSGRIFKISYNGERKTSVSAQLSELPPVSLVSMQKSSASWQTRRARELLATMAISGRDMTPAIGAANEILLEATSTPVRLRALWCLNAMNAASSEMLEGLLTDQDEAMRCWGIRLLSDNWRLDTAYGPRPLDVGAAVEPAIIERFVAIARTDTSSKVRLELASVLQRIPYEYRSELASALCQNAEDANDHNLPLMIFYGLTPLGESKLPELVSAIDGCQLPDTTRLVARRIAGRSKEEPQALEQLTALANQSSVTFRKSVVIGISEAYAGWRSAKPPAGWNSLKSSLASLGDPELANAIQNLDVIYGDGRTIDELKKVAADNSVDLELRKAALQSLVDAQAPGTKQLCLQLLRTRFLNTVAASGLAPEADPEIGRALVTQFKRFHPSERGQLTSILVSRAAWATTLLKAIEAGQIDRGYITPFHARQIASLGSEDATQLLEATWGQVRSTPTARLEKISQLKAQLSDDTLAKANLKQGRLLFQKTCSSCHKLFGAGGKLGPELTGAQRSNMDYLLENVVDPSAVVTKEFRATVILLEDDRVLTGLLTEQNENVVTLATQNETFKIAREDIAQIKQSTASTMPEGLLDQLSETQVADLIAYLRSRQQISLE